MSFLPLRPLVFGLPCARHKSGTVVPPPVLLGRLFEVKTNDQGEAKEVEIDEEQCVANFFYHV